MIEKINIKESNSFLSLYMPIYSQPLLFFILVYTLTSLYVWKSFLIVLKVIKYIQLEKNNYEIIETNFIKLVWKDHIPEGYNTRKILEKLIVYPKE